MIAENKKCGLSDETALYWENRKRERKELMKFLRAKLIEIQAIEIYPSEVSSLELKALMHSVAQVKYKNLN